MSVYLEYQRSFPAFSASGDWRAHLPPANRDSRSCLATPQLDVKEWVPRWELGDEEYWPEDAAYLEGLVTPTHWTRAKAFAHWVEQGGGRTLREFFWMWPRLQPEAERQDVLWEIKTDLILRSLE